MTFIEGIQVASLVIAAIVGLGGIASTVWSIGRVKGMDATLSMLSSGNEALRREIDDLGRRHDNEVGRLKEEAELVDRQCAERLARLEGQNNALMDGLAEKIAEAMGRQLHIVIAELLDKKVRS
jgi:hypothetical protein